MQRRYFLSFLNFPVRKTNFLKSIFKNIIDMKDKLRLQLKIWEKKNCTPVTND